jgi:hypothetical protein
MSQLPADDEIKAMIRVLAQANGITLSEERVDIVFPMYREYLQGAQLLADYPLPVEVEPSNNFNLAKGWQ